jgi:SAM-dependent methyltransferase
MNRSQIVKGFLPPLIVDAARRVKSQMILRRYLRNGKTPWSEGYSAYRTQFIASALGNEGLLRIFRRGQSLPQGYGVGVDERCIEYPWLIAHLHDGPGVLLDAGSTLNHDFILAHPIFQRKIIHILTLAPERNCFWQKGISYLFHDLRDIPVRDDYYDTITCVSTLEHVGCDNMHFTGKENHRENNLEDFLFAMKELSRILKPGGTLFLTIPFGIYRCFGSFQQFDRNCLQRAIEAFREAGEITEVFYRYTANGWNVAGASDCAECEYVEWITWPRARWPSALPIEPDFAAAARAVACVRLSKREIRHSLDA